MTSRWIPPEEEAAALRALLREYHHHNAALFGQRLRPPALGFTDDRQCLGRWVPRTRTIELRRDFVCSAPWLETVEVLKHEMAHQLVGEVLTVTGEAPHGPTFQRVCRELGIDARASGDPLPPREVSAAMRRIEKLLALGESSEVHEAEAAMRRAQALLRSHNLSLLEGRRTGTTYSFRQLGTPVLRVNEHARWVSTILRRHFFVDTLWVPAFVPGKERPGSVLEVAGTFDNLDIAEYVYGFLLGTADRLWAAHRAKVGTAARARLRFLCGVMIGFSEKLDQAEAEARPEETALIRVGDPGLRRYARLRNPRVQAFGGAGALRDETLAAGQAAGRTIVLHKGVKSSGSGGGGLLGSGT